MYGDHLRNIEVEEEAMSCKATRQKGRKPQRRITLLLLPEMML